MKTTKQVRVLDHPATYIIIDAAIDETEAKQAWLAKYLQKQDLPEEQKRKELASVRNGKVSQRANYKK